MPLKTRKKKKPPKFRKKITAGSPGTPGTSSETNIIHPANNNDICPICLEKILKEDQHTTHCGHIFHKKCLDTWCEILKSEEKYCTCPSCRQYLPNTNSPPNLRIVRQQNQARLNMTREIYRLQQDLARAGINPLNVVFPGLRRLSSRIESRPPSPNNDNGVSDNGDPDNDRQAGKKTRRKKRKKKKKKE